MAYSPMCIEGFDALTAITDLAYRGNWTVQGAGLTYRPTDGRNGFGCVRDATTGSLTARGWNITLLNRPDSVASGTTTMKLGFAFRINYSSAPSTSTTFTLMGLFNTGGTLMAGIFLKYVSGNWRIGYGNSTAALTSSYTIGPSLPASGTWFHVEVDVDEFRSSAPAGINASISVNGTTPISVAASTSNVAGSGQVLGSIRINAATSSHSLAAGESVDYDDFHCGSNGTLNDPNDGMLGDCRVDHVDPIADGTDADFLLSAGSNYYELLDEDIPGDGDTSYIYGVAADEYASVTMEALPHNPVSIFAIHPYHIARREGAGTRSSRSYIKVAGTRYEGLALWDLSHGTSYQGVWMNGYDADMLINPDTAAAYTKQDLQDIEIGIRISA